MATLYYRELNIVVPNAEDRTKAVSDNISRNEVEESNHDELSRFL